jgi:adenylate kinase family enzyme
LYLPSGDEVDRADYDAAHAGLLDQEAWIIEGFAPMKNLSSFFQRLDAADTLIYIDLPYWVTYWLVIKRFLKGLFVTPEGWPEGSSILHGTLESYKVLRLCPKFWNADFLQRLKQRSQGKTLHVIRSVRELNRFVITHAR